jgi:hypothetical protein
VTGGGSADSMLRCRLKKGDDWMKHCRKVKGRQRARLDFMGRKHDRVQRYGDVS